MSPEDDAPIFNPFRPAGTDIHLRYADHCIRKGLPWPYEFIYFFRIDGMVKIGTTVSPKNRLATIGNKAKRLGAKKIRLLRVICGGYELESELHRQFSHLHCPSEITDEGFYFTDELRAFIASLRGKSVPEDDWLAAGKARKEYYGRAR